MIQIDWIHGSSIHYLIGCRSVNAKIGSTQQEHFSMYNIIL